MRKESINTFNDGLNYDLNPIVTPSNILVDNVNGTFLTFNGDELVLQNDAGNTKIPDGLEDFVKLREGFYPIGMKEYGGVLYIVSSRSINDVLPLIVGNIYNKYDVVTDGKMYYYCLVDDLVLESLELQGQPLYWKALEPSLQSSKEVFDEIEIGSYPSIEDARIDSLSVINTTFNDSDLEEMKSLSDEVFGSGKHILFTNSTNEGSRLATNTTKPSDDLYTVKMFLRTESGLIDLTENVWDQYRKWANMNNVIPTHWLRGPNTFRYYCPFNYKGTLLSIVYLNISTLAPIHSVETKLISVIKDTDGGEYEVKFSIRKYKDYIDISQVEVSLEGSGDVHIEGTPVFSIPDTVNTITVKVKTEKDVFCNLKIAPHTLYPVPNQNFTLPSKISDRVSVNIPISLSVRHKDIHFSLLEEHCDVSLRYYSALMLNGPTGPIGFDLEPIENVLNDSIDEDNKKKPLIIVSKETEDVERANYIKIGTFLMDRDSPNTIGEVEIDSTNFDTENNSSIIPYIQHVLKGFKTKFEDDKCENILIQLVFSAPLRMLNPYTIMDGTLSLYQINSEDVLPYRSEDGRTFDIWVSRKENLTLRLNIPYFQGGVYTINKSDYQKNQEIGEIITPPTFNYGLIPVIRPTVWDAEIKNLSFYSEAFPTLYRSLWTEILGEGIDGNLMNYRCSIYNPLTKENIDVQIWMIPTSENIVLDFKSQYTMENAPDQDITMWQIITSKFTDPNQGILSQPRGTEILPGEYLNISNDIITTYAKFGNDNLGWLCLKDANEVLLLKTRDSYIGRSRSDENPRRFSDDGDIYWADMSNRRDAFDRRSGFDSRSFPSR